MQSNWAIICGAIRSWLEFGVTVKAALEMRDAGLLDGIVISTWNDGFRDKGDLRARLIDAGISIVSVPGMSQGGNGNSYRQHRLMEAALDACPTGCAVLKMRTDKCTPRLKYFVNALKHGPEPTPDSPAAFKVLKARISVLWASMTMPFGHSDVVFYGLKEDIQSMVHMDMLYDWVFYPGSANAEIRWYSRPFLRRLKLFRQFFEPFNCRRISSYMIDRYTEGKEGDIPDFFHDVLAANILCLNQNFDIVHTDSSLPTATARDLMTGVHAGQANVTPVTLAKHLVLFSNKVPAAFVERSLKKDPSNDPLYAALDRLLSPGYLERNFVTAELTRIHKETFQDTPTDFSHRAVLRYATNLYAGKPDWREKPLEPLSISDDALPDLEPEARDMALAYVQENCMDRAVELLFHELAEKYRLGDGIDANTNLCRYWLKKSAEGRYRPAQAAYARELESMGDLEGAAHWYREAARTGDTECQFALARILKNNKVKSIEDDWQEWQAKAEQSSKVTALPQS
ncbi:MAG: sel1 repeat family protein [Alphaproteobacteria bacterium]|nr:MAG: sel1 repeat family protein [Alphaproteobacteria bacterium]